MAGWFADGKIWRQQGASIPSGTKPRSCLGRWHTDQSAPAQANRSALSGPHLVAVSNVAPTVPSAAPLPASEGGPLSRATTHFRHLCREGLCFLTGSLLSCAVARSGCGFWTPAPIHATFFRHLGCFCCSKSGIGWEILPSQTLVSIFHPFFQACSLAGFLRLQSYSCLLVTRTGLTSRNIPPTKGGQTERLNQIIETYLRIYLN